jgi:phage head maturation protease
MGTSDTIYTFQATATVLNSKRVIEGVATTPRVDKENEIVTSEAIAESLPSFMTTGAPITYMHTEFVVGVVEKAYFKPDGGLFVRCRLFETEDVDYIWDLVKKGILRSFSIAFRRVTTSPQCRIQPMFRSSPCITSKVYLRSITLCQNPMNPDAKFEIVNPDIAQKGTKMKLSPEEKIMLGVGEEVHMDNPEVGKKEPASMPGDKPAESPIVSDDVAKKFADYVIPSLVDIVSKAVDEKLAEKGKKEEEEDEDKEKEDKEDVAKKSLDARFSEFESRMKSMQDSIEALLNKPLGQKGFGTIDEMGNIGYITPEGKKVDPKYLAIAKSRR